MTDDEILQLADNYMDGSLNFRTVATEELLEFARAIESRTLTNEKARWYQIGADAERHDIVKMVEQYCGAWDDKGQALVQMIRARGE